MRGFHERLLDATGCAVVATDVEGRLTYWNGGAEALFGWRASEVLGRDAAALLLEAAAARAAEPVLARLRSGASWEGTFVGRRRDATLVEVRTSGGPLLDGSGAITGFVAICSVDALARRRRRVEARRRSRERSRLEGLRASERERSDVVRGVSHDLRTPLAVVLTQARLLARDPTDPEAVARRAQAIATSAARIGRMLQDLSEVVLLEAGRLPIAARALDPVPFAEEVIERLAGTLETERVRIEVTGRPAQVHADPDQLERILVNLLSNALKYSPPEAEVRVRIAQREDEVVIAVCDHGCGIAPEDRGRLFQRFVRLASTSGVEGLGLGLHVTRKLAEAQGGRVSLASVPGAGTTVEVALPASG